MQNKKVSSRTCTIEFGAETMTDQVYHIRRKDREIRDESALLAIMSNAKYMTIAMCKDGDPYLVTVNHVCGPDGRTAYFHCAKVGKKVEFLESNPRVCGEVMEDIGYVEGKCDYDYRSVHFYGTANQVTDSSEKRKALGLMIDKLEKNPEEARKELIDKSSFKKVMIFRIDIESMTGKARAP